MTSEWTSITGATNQVKALLEHAGVPLELEVSGICKEFCASHPDVDVRSEKVVYSTVETGDIYRELDQIVFIYKELEVNTFTKVQLEVNVPIECKYRKDIEVFAFPLDKKELYLRFPIHSAFCGSAYFRHLINSYKPFSELQHASIVLLEVQDGKTPKKVHNENLIYNAAGALYDFILNDFISWDEATEKEIEAPYSDRLVDELGLFKEFESYIEQKRYAWDSALNSWISSLDEQKCSLFNQRYYKGNPPYHHVLTHLPVVCVNGPIYSIEWNATKKIVSFQEVPYCLTSLRKHGWPGLAYSCLMTRNPELPAIVTNACNLNLVLDLGLKWGSVNLIV